MSTLWLIPAMLLFVAALFCLMAAVGGTLRWLARELCGRDGVAYLGEYDPLPSPRDVIAARRMSGL